MADQPILGAMSDPLPTSSERLERLRTATPARIFLGVPGACYPTRFALELRKDHAAARDAVLADFDPERDFPADFWSAWRPLVLTTPIHDKRQYLARPDLGRRLST